MSGTPPEAPGRMPPQDLDVFDAGTRRRPVRPSGLISPVAPRWLVLGSTAAIAAFAIREMYLVLALGGLTLVEIGVLMLFVVNLFWISLPVGTAIAGALRQVWRRVRASPPSDAPLTGRTALVMPTYNEDPARVAAALEVMARDVMARGQARAFDIFMLSDTTDPDAARREHEAVWALRARLDGVMPVFYRRRLRNVAHKSGNVREFCERWGRAYDHMIVLDADSLLDGATLVELARRIEADPDAGLIQTVPRLHNARTLLARVQQFASVVYGTTLGAGLAWWTGKEGNFWGHNAILRTRAFMESAGLPELPGRPPFGGPILSHDFVEAAMIRRAGWSVIIADDLEGSYEECPPSLLDMAVRDRRWCQGNLQHSRVLRAKGFHWVSRLHLLSGIMSYLSSPLWLLFILATLALGVQNEFARPEYFTRTYTLFPLWPHIDPVRALRLFVITMAILMVPKALGLAIFAASWRRLWAAGVLLLPLSFLLEVLMSALVAPVMMLVHCGLVASILSGRDSGWRPQCRTDGSLPWSQALRRHRRHMLAGVVLAAVGAAISREMLAWLSPAVAGMVLSAALSKLTGSPWVGRVIRRLGLLRTPGDFRPPPISLALEAALPHYREAVARAPDLAAIAGDPGLLERHLCLTDRVLPRPGGEIDLVEAVAERKIRDASTREEAIERLNPRELAYVQALPALLRQLADLPAREAITAAAERREA